MKNIIKYPAVCFLLLLGAHLLGAPGVVEADSSKSKFPINDPRNPDCPCHKYQQQADREYARQLAASGENKGKVEVKGEPFEVQKKFKRVRTRHWLRPSTQAHKVKAPTRKRFRDRLSRCFHF